MREVPGCVVGHATALAGPEPSREILGLASASAPRPRLGCPPEEEEVIGQGGISRARPERVPVPAGAARGRGLRAQFSQDVSRGRPQEGGSFHRSPSPPAGAAAHWMGTGPGNLTAV